MRQTHFNLVLRRVFRLLFFDFFFFSARSHRERGNIFHIFCNCIFRNVFALGQTYAGSIFHGRNYTSFLLKGYLLRTLVTFLGVAGGRYSYRAEKYNGNKNDRRQKDCRITMRRVGRVRQFSTPCISGGVRYAVVIGFVSRFPLSKEKLFFALLLHAALSTRLILFQSKSASTRIILSTDQIIETL